MKSLVKNNNEEDEDLRSRMKVLMNKLQHSKKEKEQLAKENQSLQQEVLQMQSHLRCMVSGFNNTSQSFPMANEISNQIAEFYKCECFDIFFDVLSIELNMKGVIHFFQTAVVRIERVINEYFQPLFKQIATVGCLDNIDGPVMNVMRKAFQSNYKQIYAKCFSGLPQLRTDIQKCLKLCSDEQIDQFLGKLSEIMLNCYINDPSMNLEINSIGSRVQFNQIKHDPIDGFIKNKEECIVLMPAVVKGTEQMAKALVLSYTYQLDNM